MADLSTIPPQPAAILKSLENATSAQKAKVASTGSSSWWITAVVAVLGMVAFAVWYFIDRRNQRELAQLRHEKEVARIKAEQSVTDQMVAATKMETEKLRNQRLELAKKVLELNHEIDQLEGQRAADKLAIDRIRSWDDVPPPVSKG